MSFVKYEQKDQVAVLTIDRPEALNALNTQVLCDLDEAIAKVEQADDVRVVILTGAGRSFVAGADIGEMKGFSAIDGKKFGVHGGSIFLRLENLSKPVIAAVNGFAIGGGHVLHVVCDLTIASDNAIFGQTGPRVGSFDAGFGSSYLARVVGQKKAREIWFLCRKYNAQEALDMGLVNKVVPLAELEDEYVAWAEEMMQLSPLALRMIKVGLNAELDGQAGIQELAGDATMLYYMTDEAQEGGRAFLEKRKPEWNF